MLRTKRVHPPWGGFFLGKAWAEVCLNLIPQRWIDLSLSFPAGNLRTQIFWEGFMTRFGGWLCLVIVGAFLLGGALTGQESLPVQGNDPKGLVGAQFESEKEYQIGALPTGPILGKRTVHFQEKGNFTYAISDGIEVGTFSWNSKTGAIRGKAMSGKIYQGKYDETTKKLTWDGGKYTLIAPVKPRNKK